MPRSKSKSPPKHRIIFRQLQAEIATGRYAPGTRLPSEAQLVRRFHVSRPTAARALRDLQALGSVERRAGSGSFVSDKPSASGNVRLLGLLIPGLGSTEIFEPICGEIASLARTHEYNVLWGGSSQPWADTDASFEHADQVCHQFIAQGVAGVFFAPFEHTAARSEANRRITERLRKAGVPIVLLDRDTTVFPTRSDFDLVCIDNLAGGYILAEHLIKLGCKRLCFVARPDSAPTVDARIAGFREAMARNNLECRHNSTHYGDCANAQFVWTMLKSSHIDGIICANDHTAALLMRCVEAAGLKVPRDIRVAGFDDVKYAPLLSVPLTTIHQPCRELGALAFQAMLQRIEIPTMPPRTLMLAPRLVVRESCGAYLPR